MNELLERLHIEKDSSVADAISTLATAEAGSVISDE
jgi:hypothetical protein